MYVVSVHNRVIAAFLTIEKKKLNTKTDDIRNTTTWGRIQLNIFSTLISVIFWISSCSNKRLTIGREKEISIEKYVIFLVEANQCIWFIVCVFL